MSYKTFQSFFKWMNSYESDRFLKWTPFIGRKGKDNEDLGQSILDTYKFTKESLVYISSG